MTLLRSFLHRTDPFWADIYVLNLAQFLRMFPLDSAQAVSMSLFFLLIFSLFLSICKEYHFLNPRNTALFLEYFSSPTLFPVSLYHFHNSPTMHQYLQSLPALLPLVILLRILSFTNASVLSALYSFTFSLFLPLQRQHKYLSLQVLSELKIMYSLQ